MNIFFKKLSLLIIGLVVTGIGLFAQETTGTIRGSVIDPQGQPMPRVRVVLKGISGGTISDLDGKFELKAAPGTYSLVATFISFDTLVITDLLVKADEVTVIDQFQMNETVNTFGTITITAERVVTSESGVLKMKQNSVNLIDGISSANFRNMGSSDGASAVQSVPGISVSGGKYVYVRGLGDRYNKTVLNGMDIPGLDPDRNTLQMDIFPTSILDNIVVHKSFVAELPADFTGGIIDIGLKDFPEKQRGSVYISGGYNPGFHFNSDYLTYEGGKTDFLGFDDGTRAIPAVSNIPFFSQAVGNPDGTNGQRYQEILASFNPTLAAMRQRSFMDYSLGATYGNQVKKEKVTLGYNFVLSYKNSTEFYQDVEFGRYGLSSNPDITEMEVRESQTGEYGSNNVLLTGMAGFAIKTVNSKYRISALHLQNGESKAGIFDYYNADQGSVFNGFQHNLEYSQRSLSGLIIDGKHSFDENAWLLEWKVAPTLSSIYDPDIRFTRYEDRDSLFTISTESGFPERIWRELVEKNLSGQLHVTKNFQLFKRDAKLKFGGAYTYKERSFIVRTFAINVRNMDLTGNPDELFAPENLWPYNGNPNQGTTYEANFAPTNPNKFDASVNNTAVYGSLEASPTKRLKAILGVRIERYVQLYTGQDQLGTNVLDNDKVLENLGIFPSLNLVYAANEKQNLRLSYGKTVARPSFKELSYAEIYDPITGRTFIGGLFRDADDASGKVYWDGNLRSTDIHNFDLRWEIFNAPGQTVSISAFYKMFINPIEIVQFSAQAGSFQPRNVGNGQVLGTEVELRQSLKFIGKKLEDFSLTLNFTITESRIELSQTEYESRLANARTGQTVKTYRDMAGQAPFLINAGFSYNGGEKGFAKGLQVGLFYNVQGKTLEYVGIVDRPDIYVNSFHSLNFNAIKTFGKKDQFSGALKIENLLNDSKESVFVSYMADDQYFTRLRPGTTVQLKFSYNF